MAKKKYTRKKSYNPFKMWGSYAGAGFFLLWLFIIPPMLINNALPGFFEGMSYITTISPLAIIFNIVLGFLIGWGIHSLFRKLSRRRK